MEAIWRYVRWNIFSYGFENSHFKYVGNLIRVRNMKFPFIPVRVGHLPLWKVLGWYLSQPDGCPGPYGGPVRWLPARNDHHRRGFWMETFSNYYSLNILDNRTQNEAIEAHDILVHFINFHYMYTYVTIKWSLHHKWSNINPWVNHWKASRRQIFRRPSTQRDSIICCEHSFT